MNKRTSIINIFTFSMRPKKYIYLIKEKLSKAFIYVLLLSVILGIIQGCMSIYVISNVEKTVEIFLKQDELKFEMKDGILNFPASPLKEEEGQTLLYIDTTKSLDDLDSIRNITVHKEEVTVILKDGVMTKFNSEQSTFKYSDYGLDKININNDIVITALNKIYIIKYFIIPFVIIVKFIQLLMWALMISLVGVVNNLISPKKIKYKKIFALSIYAITLPALINLIYPIGALSVLIGGFTLMFGINYINYYDNKDIQ